MDANLNLVLDQVSKDKGIDRSVLISALEEAILVAAKRSFGAERNLVAKFNEEKGAVDLTQSIKVVENVEDGFNEISLKACQERSIEVESGDEMVFPIYYLDQDAAAAREQDETYGDILRLKTYRRGFGRIAAQTAKQVIIQRIRDAERSMVFSEYKDRKGELVTGIVRRFERGNIVVDLGRAESILPLREQCPRESYRAGDRIQAFVIDVQEHARGPQIVLSRTTPQLLIKLFELEVPEIYEGVVRIESAAREPGARAKIAVSSSDRDVDPVGACVGMKGSRVQAVVQELRGEKIDIVPYSEDPATFVCNALQPAEVSRVLIDEGSHRMEIIVPDDQLSLAIGRKGQNVRLASQLAGWELNIHSESRIQEIKDKAWTSLSKVEGCNEFLIQTLYNHGIRSAEQLIDAQREFLMQFPGMTDETLDKIVASAKLVANEEHAQEERLKLEAEQAAKAANAGKRLQEILGLNTEGRMKRVRGLGEGTLKQLAEGGITTVEALADVEVDKLAEIAKTSDKKAKQLKYAAMQWLKSEKEIRDGALALGVTVVDGMVRIPGQEPATPKEAPAAPAATADPAAPAATTDPAAPAADGDQTAIIEG
ncbi:MAG: transcription termination/antitermination protein NusA [Deltaproteobacteria bacterium]|nr:transcription termination/antitermination protein NusA [Deltaproteobacteria bacterium]